MNNVYNCPKCGAESKNVTRVADSAQFEALCSPCNQSWLTDEKGNIMPPTGGNYPTTNPNPGIRRAQKFSIAQLSSMPTRKILNSVVEFGHGRPPIGARPQIGSRRPSLGSRLPSRPALEPEADPAGEPAGGLPGRRPFMRPPVRNFAPSNSPAAPRFPARRESSEEMVQKQAETLVLLTLREKGHKPGCGCGFCKNKGSFGKKDKSKEKPNEMPAAEA